MTRVIHVTLDPDSIRRAMRKLDDYEVWLRQKADQLTEKLAAMGAVSASLGFARAIYDGPNDTQIEVERRGENTYAVVAEGTAVLFIEFGAGVTYGDGHPKAGEFGYGPTTYPGQKHAADPAGWYIPKSKGGGHTYGNPPNAPMYHTAEEIRQRVQEVAREVFRS